MSAEEEQALLELSPAPDFQAAAQELIGFTKQRAGTLPYLQLRDQLNRAQTGLASQRRLLGDQQDALTRRG